MGTKRSGFAVAVLVAGLAGCTTVPPAGPPADPAGGSAVLTAAALDLAVRAEPYREEQSLLRRTEHALTRDCMARRGYPYPAAGTDTVLDDPWRPDLDSRRRHGYGFARPGPSAGRYPPGLTGSQRSGYESALSGERRATLRLSSGPRFTFATTGCLAESRIRLYGDVMDAARADYVPQEAFNALLPHIAADPDLHEATRKWSSCMRGRGHPYDSMSAARAAVSSALRANRPAGEALTFETAVAVADGECALAVGLPPLVDRLGRRHAGKLTAVQRRDLNTAADVRAAALLRAASG
ncbi:hypothetical protein [Paractinoplanes brasiliensis]|uniref:Uncharacterized protein n=1 Tax=Paractinoplanes brasiliensis TaxID=52695 RepID=A0A4R6JM64_9ACTN|nr:hypothetical protein [Actinoplanes brasiliensis]TDO36927.1 hypothetical protein C8E87_0517 [Actinoplanes brasiliensis]GID30449.1 hypothetical protein Abr02nite_54320 [Actinoplanes brasiliensis]